MIFKRKLYPFAIALIVIVIYAVMIGNNNNNNNTTIHVINNSDIKYKRIELIFAGNMTVIHNLNMHEEHIEKLYVNKAGQFDIRLIDTNNEKECFYKIGVKKNDENCNIYITLEDSIVRFEKR